MALSDDGKIGWVCLDKELSQLPIQLTFFSKLFYGEVPLKKFKFQQSICLYWVLPFYVVEDLRFFGVVKDESENKTLAYAYFPAFHKML